MSETTELKTFRQLLHEGMRRKNMSPQRLAQETDIASTHIKALLEEDFDLLPPTPYVRGYLSAIATVLESDFETLWQQYKKEADLKQAGSLDKLPTNRFAQKPINKKALLIVLLIIIALALIVPQLADFLGKPSLQIMSPPSDNVESASEMFLITGVVKNAQDTVSINGEKILVRDDGSFSKEVPLESGRPNIFTISAQRFLGRKTTISRTILYNKPIPQFESPASSTPQQSTTTPLL